MFSKGYYTIFGELVYRAFCEFFYDVNTHTCFMAGDKAVIFSDWEIRNHVFFDISRRLNTTNKVAIIAPLLEI